MKRLGLIVAIFIMLGLPLGMAPPSGVQSAGDAPLIHQASVQPTKVYPGDTMTVTAEVSDSSGIESVTADMGGIETISLSLIEGTIEHGTWQGQWLVHHTTARDYVTTIVATNYRGKSSATGIVWRDPQTYERFWNTVAGPIDSNVVDPNWTDAHTITFTPNVAGDFLVISSATLTNDDTSTYTEARVYNATDATVINTRQFTPALTTEKCTFGCHEVVSLIGDTEYIFKTQIRTGNNSYYAHAEDLRFNIFAVSDYEHIVGTPSITTSESYVDIATLTFTPSPLGDYIIIASAEIAYDSTSESFYARLYYDTGSADWGEMARQPTATTDFHQYHMVKKVNLSATEHVFKLQCRRQAAGSGTVTYRRACIVAIRATDLGDVQYTEVDGPSSTNSTAYQLIGTVSWDPTTNENYFRFGCRFLNLDDTGKFAWVAVYEDDVLKLERDMQPNAVTDYIPLWGGLHRYMDDTAHTVKHYYKSSSPSANASVKNTRILMISMDTLNPFGESTHDNYNNNFDTQAEDTVYIQGCYFERDTAYHVAYYDNGGAKVLSDGGVTSDANGVVNSQWYFPDNTGAAAGTWHAVIYKDPTSPAATYTANDPNSIQECTFTVTSDAIPEFPTVFAGIGVGGLCFAIYWWMRRRMAVSKQ